MDRNCGGEARARPADRLRVVDRARVMPDVPGYVAASASLRRCTIQAISPAGSISQ